MGLIDLNKEERDAKRAKLSDALWQFGDSRMFVEWFLEDADIVRGFLARSVMREHMPQPFSRWEQEAHTLGREHYGRFVRRLSELPRSLRDSITDYINEGFSDPYRMPRFEARGKDADIIRELLDRPLSPEALEEVKGDG